MIKKLTVVILLGAMLIAPIFAAPMFSDVNSKHWAADAVAQLAAKGIVEGYPDGTFKGDRAATRWEMAMMVARLLAKDEQMWSTFATKEDMQVVKQLLDEYAKELEALGVRTTEVEKVYNNLDARVTDIEHIRFYGTLDTIYVGQQMGGALATAGQANAFTVNDWSNGRPLVNGKAVTALCKLGMESTVAGYNLGTEFAGYYAYGEPAVDNYWGVTPPYLSNPFTADSGAAALGSMNAPISKLSLDKFWLRNQKNDAKLTLGSYNPSLIGTYILLGQKNPNLNAPTVLPFYGANYNSWFTVGKSNPIYYEAMYSKMPSASNVAAATTNYYITNLFSAGIGHNFLIRNLLNNDVDSKFKLGFLTISNDNLTNGVLQGAGLINIPARSDPAGAGRSQGWQGSVVVGPQMEGIYGASIEFMFPNTFKLAAEYARSKYNADRTNTNFRSGIWGSLGRIGVEYKPTQWNINAEYVSVSPTYDPFLAQFPAAQNMPVFLPYSTYYSNYYQLHDDQKYPNNRNGYDANINYTFKNGRTIASASYGYQQQKMASTPTNISGIGFIEPFFPELRGAGSDDKGTIRNFGINLGHTFKNNFQANLGYYDYRISRNGSVSVNDGMSLKEKVAALSLSYPFNDKFTAYGNYSLISYNGTFVDQTSQNFKQGIPSIAASYQLSDNALMIASYKCYNFYNYAVNASDWNGRQTSLEVKMNF